MYFVLCRVSVRRVLGSRCTCEHAGCFRVEGLGPEYAEEQSNMQELQANHAEAASQASIAGVLIRQINKSRCSGIMLLPQLPKSCFSHVTIYTKQLELEMPEPRNPYPSIIRTLRGVGALNSYYLDEIRPI